MPAPSVERRLAAILAADVVGYSRLMERDETGTLERLKTCRKEVVEPLLAERRGRLVKLMGDGLLCEFASIVDAICCAVQIQAGVTEHNAGLAEAERIVFRIGVSLGDVLAEDGDIYGEAVNLAARLQALAQPSDICVSGQVHDEVRSKLPYCFDHLGERSLKNIERPVRVYTVRPATEDRTGVSGGSGSLPALSDRLSLAVLPFANLSGDPQQEPLADGITEDVITDLTRFRDLDVIARHSSFGHKSKAMDARQVGQELGVRYVLGGSLQRQSDRIRVSAQLVDVATNVRVWSERWERSAADVFAVQTEIAEQTSNLLAGQGVILHAAAASAKRKRPGDLTAYESYLLGREHNARLTPHDAEQAVKYFHAALEREPNLARAWVGLASSFSQLAGFSSEPEPWDRKSVEAARRAVEVDPMDADAHSILGEGLGYAGEPAEAEAALERAAALNPSSADILARYAGWAPRFGKPERGAEAADRARLLNPHWPVWYNMYLCRAYFFVGRYADALAMLESKPVHSLHLQDLVYATASAAMLGRLEQARLWRERTLANCPELTAEWHVRRGGTGIGHEAQRRQLAELMVMAEFALCANVDQAAGLLPWERFPECEAERAKMAATRT